MIVSCQETVSCLLSGHIALPTDIIAFDWALNNTVYLTSITSITKPTGPAQISQLCHTLNIKYIYTIIIVVANSCFPHSKNVKQKRFDLGLWTVVSTNLSFQQMSAISLCRKGLFLWIEIMSWRAKASVTHWSSFLTDGTFTFHIQISFWILKCWSRGGWRGGETHLSRAWGQIFCLWQWRQLWMMLVMYCKLTL